MDKYDIGMWGVLFIGMIIIFGIGFINGSPKELENGCIVHESKVYCEKVEKGE